MTDAEKHLWEDGDDLVVVLDLPSGPREYVVEDVDAETGLWAQALGGKTRKAVRRRDAGESLDDIDADLHLSDEEEWLLYQRLLGPTLEDMKADGVKWRQTKLMGEIAYAWVVMGLDAARRCWEAGGTAPKPNRAQKRAAGRASGSRSSGSGASANTTRSRTSTKSTKTRSPRSTT